MQNQLPRVTATCVPHTSAPTPMARWPRVTVPGLPLHITHRGNNRIAIFADEMDVAQYRTLLQHTSTAEDCAIHAYALMTNHVHLLVTPQSVVGASRMMQRLGSLYVRYFNARHHRSGTLWEGRFKSALVDSATYFLTCSRYIDLNPVRAGIVRTPAAYPWSSFACLGQTHPDPLVTQHAEYLGLGQTAAQRARIYRALCGVGVTDIACEKIRTATHGGGVLGTAAFEQQIGEALQRHVTRLPHGGNRRRMSRTGSAEACSASRWCR